MRTAQLERRTTQFIEYIDIKIQDVYMICLYHKMNKNCITYVIKTIFQFHAEVITIGYKLLHIHRNSGKRSKVNRNKVLPYI